MKNGSLIVEIIIIYVSLAVGRVSAVCGSPLVVGVKTDVYQFGHHVPSAPCPLPIDHFPNVSRYVVVYLIGPRLFGVSAAYQQFLILPKHWAPLAVGQHVDDVGELLEGRISGLLSSAGCLCHCVTPDAISVDALLAVDWLLMGCAGCCLSNGESSAAGVGLGFTNSAVFGLFSWWLL